MDPAVWSYSFDLTTLRCGFPLVATDHFLLPIQVNGVHHGNRMNKARGS